MRATIHFYPPALTSGNAGLSDTRAILSFLSTRSYEREPCRAKFKEASAFLSTRSYEREQYPSIFSDLTWFLSTRSYERELHLNLEGLDLGFLSTRSYEREHACAISPTWEEFLSTRSYERERVRLIRGDQQGISIHPLLRAGTGLAQHWWQRSYFYPPALTSGNEIRTGEDVPGFISIHPLLRAGTLFL